MASTELAQTFYTKALCWGMVYEEKRVKSLFAKKVENGSCDCSRLYWSSISSEPLTQSGRYANSVTKISGSRSTASRSTNRPNRGLSSIHNWYRRSNQSFNVSVEGKSPIKSVPHASEKNQTNSTTLLDMTTYCRVCLREHHKLVKCPMVLQHTK